MEDIKNKEAALEVQALEQLNLKIESGEFSINQARAKFGLSPLIDKSANEKITKVLFDSSKELD